MELEQASYEKFLRHFTIERDRLFRYVHSLLPHRDDAEDVFQRCSILLWQKFETFDTDRDFFSWACGIAFYEVKNFLRASARSRLSFDAELLDRIATSSQAYQTQQSDRVDALRLCLGQLKSHDRSLIEHVYSENGSLTEFSVTSGKAVQTLYNRLSQLRRELLACVDRRLRLEGNLR